MTKDKPASTSETQPCSLHTKRVAGHMPSKGEVQLDNGTWVFQEGLAQIHKTEHAFYNPVQEFNRDLSVAVIRTWREQRSKELRAECEKKNKPFEEFQPTLLEALAATGLRSIRYAKEIPLLKKILCNDLDPEAVATIRKNLELNQISEELVEPHVGDANAIMYQHRSPSDQFQIIDLDPYGSAAPFLDAAIQGIANHGLLCVTCTDMQVLAGANYTETCFSKYGGYPLKGDLCHEMALRLLLGCIQRIAARHRKVVEPLMSCSIDFYVRVFVQLHNSPMEVKKTASKTSLVFQCRGCKSIEFQAMGTCNETKFGATTHHVPLECPECQSKWAMGGPIYNGPIHSHTFVSALLQHLHEDVHYGTHPRMQGMVSVISEELPLPLYYTVRTLSTAVHTNTIPMIELGSALLNAKYRFSVSHANPTGVKTDAPCAILWDIIRAHAKKYNPKPVPDSIAHRILSKELTWQPDFSYHPDAQPKSKKYNLLRFQENPTREWGPKSRPQKKRRERDELTQVSESDASKKVKEDDRAVVQELHSVNGSCNVNHEEKVPQGVESN